MSPRDEDAGRWADFGPFNALPALIAFWLLMLAGAAAGFAAYHFLIATECAR